MALNQTTVAIIGALDDEVALITRALQHVRHDHAAGLDVSVGQMQTDAGDAVQVVATVGGMGLVNAAATSQFLIDAYHPQALIFSGIAGNLNKDMHINDVVLGGTLVYLDSDMDLISQFRPNAKVFHSDPQLLELAQHVLDGMGIKYVVGVIASGNHFVDTPDKIEEVTQQTHADAVEMEGAAVAHVAARNEVRVLVIRALSDNADTDYEIFKTFDISQYADTAATMAVRIVEGWQQLNS